MRCCKEGLMDFFSKKKFTVNQLLTSIFIFSLSLKIWETCKDFIGIIFGFIPEIS